MNEDSSHSACEILFFGPIHFKDGSFRLGVLPNVYQSMDIPEGGLAHCEWRKDIKPELVGLERIRRSIGITKMAIIPLVKGVQCYGISNVPGHPATTGQDARGAVDIFTKKWRQ